MAAGCSMSTASDASYPITYLTYTSVPAENKPRAVEKPTLSNSWGTGDRRAILELDPKLEHRLDRRIHVVLVLSYLWWFPHLANRGLAL